MSDNMSDSEAGRADWLAERAQEEAEERQEALDLAQHRGEQYPSYNWIVRLQEEYLNDNNNRRDPQKYQGVLDMFAEYGEYSHQEMKKCYNAMHLPKNERESVMRAAGQVIMTNGGFKALQYNWYTMVNFVLGRCNCESRCPRNREVHNDIKNTISLAWNRLVDSSGNVWRS